MEKILLKSILLVIVIAAVFLVCDYFLSLNVLQLKIRPDRQVYETGDHINIEFELKNTGPETLRINSNFALHTDLKPHFTPMVGGKELAWLPPPPPAPVNESSFVRLVPGETLKYNLDMLDSHLTVTQAEGYPKPGTYSVRIDYTGINEDASGRKYDAWNGMVSSNTIEILVREKID